MTIRQFALPVYTPPFSHSPGVQGWLTGSPFVVRLFPAAFELHEVTFDTQAIVARFELPDIHHPTDWTVFFDTLHHAIQVEGRSEGVFFRFRIAATPDGVTLSSAKGPLRVVSLTECVVQKGETITLCKTQCEPIKKSSRLLLGCHKAPNWDRVRLHPSMDEVMTYWYQMGTSSNTIPFFDTPSLLTSLIDSIKRTDRKSVCSDFETFFRAATSDFFVPKRIDDLYLGYQTPLVPKEVSLLEIPHIISSAMRSLFIQEAASCVTLLPCLPSPFLSGRILQERLQSGHNIDFEWRKGVLRRLVIQPAKDDTLIISTPFRIFACIRSLKKGEKKQQILLGDPIVLQKGEHLLVDNFSS